MKRYLSLSILLLTIIPVLKGQSVTKSANDAFMISRMLAKYHVQPKTINAEFSSGWFDNLVKQLDEEKLFLTQADMLKLQVYRLSLDKELLNRKPAFLELLISIYSQRLKQADSLIDIICKQPFRFNTPEKFSVAEITGYPADITGQRLKWFKLLKGSVLTDLLEFEENLKVTRPDARKKTIDSLEIIVRQKNGVHYKRIIKKIIEGPGGVQQVVSTAYCQTLATCFDPHSEFLPPSQKENLESSLGNTPMQFGLQLKENKNGDIVIDNLKPGSPAFKSGQLNSGDIIQAVQWEGKEKIELSGADQSEMSDILDASNHDKLMFTIKKVDGSTAEVGLIKERAEQADDDNKIKSFLISGKKKLGYISLPAFYTNWENNDDAADGCSDDIAKELIRMKKEGIGGLILDLRYNGGGSMKEAVDLAGIFIDAGPVAQTKGREEKPFTVKDVNRGTIYDGPLLIMVNGYSASASEVLAGTLQDYHRALIVGSPTYGKATAQVILPLDTTIDLNTSSVEKPSASFVKVTINKLYRINGSSAQATGVQPDILLSDFLEADPHRETNIPFSFPTSNVPPNKYYTPYPALPVADLKVFARSLIDTSAYFNALQKHIQAYREELKVKDIPLSWAEATAERKKSYSAMKEPGESNLLNATLSVTNITSEEQRIKSDSNLQQVYNMWRERISRDPYIQISVRLLSF